MVDPISFTAIGSVWTVGSKIVKYFEWKSEDKKVDREWLQASGFGSACAENGLELVWARAERVETLITKGYELVHQDDADARVHHRILLGDTVLMAKPK